VVLVDRGVAAPEADRSRLPVIATPSGEVEVRGRAYLAPRHTLELKPDADSGSLWQNLTPEKFSQASGLRAHAFLLRQTDGAAPAGLIRAPEAAPIAESGMTAAKHRGYAFQWYSLCALTAVLWVFFTFFRHDQSA